MNSISEIPFYVYLAYTVLNPPLNFEEVKDVQNEPQKISWRPNEVLSEYLKIQFI